MQTHFKAVRLNATTYPIESAERDELGRAGAELTVIEGQVPDDILRAAADCDALLVVSSRLPASVIEGLRRCRVIARLGAGTDRIDVAAATQAGIVVANVPDFCTYELAEHAMALLLTWARRLPYMQAEMRRGNWSARHHPEVHRIAGRALGFIGFGLSAAAVAERARGFGLRLLAWVRNPDKYRQKADALGVTLVDLDRLLAESDFVSIHVPLTSDTRHLIGARELARMKPTALLINTARGAIVNERALVQALREHQIGGAALDVFEELDVFAPPGAPPSHPLLELDDVILTPHSGGSSVESTRDSKVRGARNAADVLMGRWPEYVVNPEVTPRFPLQPKARRTDPPAGQSSE